MANRISATDKEKYFKLPEVVITLSEFNRRKKEWTEYYEAVKHTRSYERFFEQKEALRSGDLTKVKILAEEARQQMINQDYLPKPEFPDPELELQYHRIGVREWLVNYYPERKNEIEAKMIFDPD